MPEKSSLNDDIQKMQAEAIKRVRELHSRSKSTAVQNLKKSESNNDSTQKSNFEKPVAVPISKHRHSSFKKMPNLVELLFSDSDKTLLIVLIILLMDDEENFSIVLVLLYLLM